MTPANDSPSPRRTSRGEVSREGTASGTASTVNAPSRPAARIHPLHRRHDTTPTTAPATMTDTATSSRKEPDA